MKINIVGKNITITKALEDRISKKLKGLEKYFLIAEDDSAKVLLTSYPNKNKIEVTIPTKAAILRAETSDLDMYNAIDKVVDKLKDQIRRQKTRLESRKDKASPLYEAFLDYDILGQENPNDEIVKTKSIAPERLSLDEAITKMDLLGHSFFIYLDDETDKPAVVYVRNDGGYGLIETE
ncbi:ribosome hibernation-promoting factor, HPF/YfiA family [Allobaculum mucilyticum]|uniref:ribosome hibernation-promoting factor, HPF/YfiA family n=1 Tax=Allobaculum mucilyticum TaxID=2834459 RepID=UPI001E373367|nr:ribosome-associated translation inhibitor RaiA [Allobaculum mucilyticum]UNT96121.1 ribosome-associated translation inhibitor RaiA [Allobaculum mucilyticum]